MAGHTVVNLHINAPPTVLGKRSARDRDGDGALDSVDLSKPLPHPAPEEVVEAMRQRILQLETQLHAAKKQKTSAGAKSTTLQQTTLPVAGPSGSKSATPGPSGVKDAKADAKILKARCKSLFDQLKKAAKAEKYQNVVRTVKIEEHFSFADFELVFGTSGTLVQPTPTNKPKSTVYIRTYGSDAQLAALFGDAWKPDQLKGHQWTVGSIFAGKSQKLGQVTLNIQHLEVQWSKGTEKAVLKAEICERDGDGDIYMGGRMRGSMYW
ncbi:hypothetical protein EIP86_006862 [Pleurotus ostreatoroseus]|nr:hypothetical protein EIP86_006862 [Pleurotus ostreatoroseus]